MMGSGRDGHIFTLIALGSENGGGGGGEGSIRATTHGSIFFHQQKKKEKNAKPVFYTPLQAPASLAVP